jgi:AAA+ ATPase superfamily predicted ATPase
MNIMKEAPFVFGRMATVKEFTDREKETEQLVSNFQNHINTIIISPRRWGKTSLVNKVAEKFQAQKSDIKVCQIDLFTVRKEEDFYLTLAKEVLKASSSQWEEIINNAKTFLSRFIPQITFSPDTQDELSFGIEWKEIKKNPNDILNLAESIAVAKNIQLVICIDEFQSISEYEDPLAFQKKLRAHWQRHTHVTYCLYGSKRHMLLNVFTSVSMPFYKFGDLIFLSKISTENWVSFIKKRFKDTGKSITAPDARLIANLVDNHSYYVQQLAMQAWLRTDKKCDSEIVRKSHVNIADQLSLLFTNTTESLATTQISFLQAILANETQLSSQSTLEKYRMGTSANIARIKKALLEREIIDIIGDKIEFQDPMYRYWLQEYYFKRK